MSEPVAVRWVPAPVLASFSEALLRATAAWSQAWGLPPPKLLSCESVAARTPVLAADEEFVDLAPTLSRALFGPGAEQSSLANAVVAQATNAWRDALGSVLGLAPGQGWPMAGSAPFDHPGDRGVRCTLQVAGQPVSIFIGMEPLCQSQWIQIPSAPAMAAWRPETVMAHLPLTLEAVLGTASVAVGELAAMEAGDIVLMAQGADGAVRLRGLQSASELRATLGHMDGRRAIRLVASSQGA